MSEIPCTYSMTVKLDITQIRKKNLRLYPNMLYCITKVVNRRPEFRTAYNPQGELGIYGQMNPSYTIFHKESESFSLLWTAFSDNYADFCAAYEKDLQTYGQTEGMLAKAHMPENCVDVSMIPWVRFESFQLNLQKGYRYLLPIFTMGQFYTEGDKTFLPFAMQVHHGVCDGFHASRFLRELQDLVNEID